MIDYLQLFDDYAIDYALEGKNVGNNFIGIHCPWCNDSSYHGGVPKDGSEKFSCWRCGTHSVRATLAVILHVKNIDTILQSYDGGSDLHRHLHRQTTGGVNHVTVPGDTLQWYHEKYLVKRRYDPDYLVAKYKVQGTTPYETDFKMRSKVIFPISYNQEIVSYQGRSIRDDAVYRYITAPPEEEKIFHKHLLYNLDYCKEDWVVMVEGVFDALRLGDNACATFGTTFLPQQLLLLKPYKRIYMLYDNEFNAQEKARKAASMLSSIVDGEVYVTDIGQGKDPDDLSDDDARYVMNEFRRVVR